MERTWDLWIRRTILARPQGGALRASKSGLANWSGLGRDDNEFFSEAVYPQEKVKFHASPLRQC